MVCSPLMNLDKLVIMIMLQTDGGCRQEERVLDEMLPHEGGATGTPGPLWTPGLRPVGK